MRGDIRGVCKNLRYALTIICKASPTRLLVTMLESVLRGTALFMLDVYLLRVIVNSVQAGTISEGWPPPTLWIAGSLWRGADFTDRAADPLLSHFEPKDSGVDSAAPFYRFDGGRPLLF